MLQMKHIHEYVEQMPAHLMEVGLLGVSIQLVLHHAMGELKQEQELVIIQLPWKEETCAKIYKEFMP